MEDFIDKMKNNSNVNNSKKENIDFSFIKDEKHTNSICCICDENCGKQDEFPFLIIGETKKKKFYGSFIKSHINGEVWEAFVCEKCTQEKLAPIIKFEIKNDIDDCLF